MAKGEREPGEITRDDLIEALRVNRSLLVQASADLHNWENRQAIIRERIAEAELKLAEWRAAHESAPERIERLRAKIAQQEQALEAITMKPTSERISREVKIAALIARISAGDTGAIGELKALVG